MTVADLHQVGDAGEGHPGVVTQDSLRRLAGPGHRAAVSPIEAHAAQKRAGGCGLGMASLVINARGGDILATDYHPRAEVFLHDNSRRNALTDTPFQRLDWRVPDPDLGIFDLIIGSDLLYEPDHPLLLSEFLARHSDAMTRIIIVDPKRRLHVRFRKRMEAAGFTSQSDAGTPAQWAAFGFKGVVQRFDGFNPPQ